MSFAELREAEREGLRPSLVFSPMPVEDSRRLIIRNLDLDHLTISFSQQWSEREGPLCPSRLGQRQLLHLAARP
jgi:hypothetical protein